MNQKRSKITIASLILASAMIFLAIVGVRDTSMRRLTPDVLLAETKAVDNKAIQVDGLILEGSSKWDAAKFELTFAIRDREGKAKVDVIYASLKPDNFKDGGPVSVEGNYSAAQNLIVATKLQTKCASKYEAAENVTGQADY